METYVAIGCVVLLGVIGWLFAISAALASLRTQQKRIADALEEIAAAL